MASYYTRSELDELLQLKADKVKLAVVDDFASLKQDGNIKDSGVNATDVLLNALYPWADGGEF